MRRILISTAVGDIHATAVAVALRRMGHRPYLWYVSDLPVRAAASLAFGQGAAAWGDDITLDLPHLPEHVSGIDTYWHRRRGDPVIDTPLLPSDLAIAERESVRMVNGLMDTLSHSAFAVNSLRASRNAEDKIAQLRLAQRLGMALPETLVSNSPERVRRFVAEHERCGAVVKNFAPICWLSGDKAALNFTARLTSDMLPSDAMLRLTPAIYQAQVPKAYEVRLTCIGAERVAVVLDSQQQAAARMDWRGTAPKRLGIRRIDIPAEVAAHCTAFLAAMDLRFGCFDFIVTPQGEWVFLEINQMGQFLWIEESAPDLPLLQMFCDLLVQRNPAYRYAGRGTPIGFADVVEEAAEMVKAAPWMHQHPEVPPNVYAES